MSYLVLARKYRPKAFSEVAGQDVVTRTLRWAIAEGRVGHAYLFFGPRGTGKTTSARLFPKALNYVGVLISVGAFATIVPALELVGVVFGLGLIVWLGWLGVVMYRGSPSETTLPGDRSQADAIGDRLTDSPSDRRTFA